MNVLRKTFEKSSEEMRKVFGDTLIKIGKENESLIVMDADCKSSVGTSEFESIYPERYINCGIMESNAVGIASGLGIEGFTPVFSTFAVFATRRPYDQIMLSMAYAKSNVKLVGWDIGLSGGSNGGTHMSMEDMGIMRNVPNMIVAEATDPVMFSQLIKQAVDIDGNVYIRSVRKSAIDIYEPASKFKLGKGEVLTEGNDITIIACGIMVNESLRAAEMIKKEGFSVRVVDMFTIKPIDKQLVIDCAEKTKLILTVENHSIINGLGSAVSEVCSEYCPVKVIRMGVNDQFGEVGDTNYLLEKFKLSSRHISERALILIKENEEIG